MAQQRRQHGLAAGDPFAAQVFRQPGLREHGLDDLAGVVLAGAAVCHADCVDVGPQVGCGPVSAPGQRAHQTDAGGERQERLRADGGALAVIDEHAERARHVHEFRRHGQRLGLPGRHLTLGFGDDGNSGGVQRRFCRPLGHGAGAGHAFGECPGGGPVRIPRRLARRMEIAHGRLQIGPCYTLVHLVRHQPADRVRLPVDGSVFDAIRRAADGLAGAGQRAQPVWRAAIAAWRHAGGIARWWWRLVWWRCAMNRAGIQPGQQVYGLSLHRYNAVVVVALNAAVIVCLGQRKTLAGQRAHENSVQSRHQIGPGLRRQWRRRRAQSSPARHRRGVAW